MATDDAEDFIPIARTPNTILRRYEYEYCTVVSDTDVPCKDRTVRPWGIGDRLVDRMGSSPPGAAESRDRELVSETPISGGAEQQTFESGFDLRAY